jgi:hypothetical protein
MRRIGRKALAAAAVAGLIASAMSMPATARQKNAPLKGEGEGLKIVANVGYEGGSDMEFATIKGHDYAFASQMPGADGGGLHVINIDKPEKPKEVAFLPCAVSQGDVQFSHDMKTVMTAADSPGGPDSCLAVGKTGFMTIDIRNPKKPKPIGFAEIPRGSHNITAHPTKPYVYNSDSDLEGTSDIQIWNIKNPKKPTLVKSFISGVHSPHDISFNADGTRAVTANISSITYLNTEDPENPTVISITQCPGCSITHDAKFTPDGTRVIVGDEGGGGLPYPCPGGALYFYDVVGDAVLQPTGVYEPGEVVLARDGQTAPEACTSHVFDISDDGTKVSISWYSAGTRYLDVSNPVGPTFGGQGTGVVELGWFMPDGGNSWSSKFYKGNYIYSNDINRGFDVFKIEAPE